MSEAREQIGAAPRGTGRGRAWYIAAAILVAAGVFLLAFAWRADHEWFAHHIQRHFDKRDEERSFGHWRVGALVLGLGLLAAAPRIARWVERIGLRATGGHVFRCLLMVPLSLVAAELILRKALPPPPPPGTIFPIQNPDRPLIRPDDRLGWANRSSYAQVVHVGGRDVSYAYDALGDRVRSVDDKLDPTRRSIAFLGESIMVGHGLQYDETIPAIVEERTGLQAINLSVPGYGSDQQYQRFLDVLPSLPPLAAVVTFFLAPQLERLEWPLRPRLRFREGEPHWLPPVSQFWADNRLATLWRNDMKYHDDTEVETTREIFRRTAEAARQRGATALFVFFTWGPPRPPIESHDEAWLYRELFADQGLSAILVGAQDFMDDGHPTAAACAPIAESIAQALQGVTAR